MEYIKHKHLDPGSLDVMGAGVIITNLLVVPGIWTISAL